MVDAARYAREVAACVRLGVRLRDQVGLALDTLRFHAGNKGWLGNGRDPVSTYQIRIGGAVHEVQLRTFSGDFFVFHEIFIDEPYWIPASYATSADTVVDLGANIGMTTLYLSDLAPQAHFVCVEAHPHNAELLRQNVSALAPRVDVVEGAISDHAGTTLFEAEGPAWGTKLSSGAEGVEVPAYSMEALMSEYDIDNIDILKIDIEGAERLLLRNHTEWLGRVKLIMIELHEGYSLAEFRDVMNTYSLEVFEAGSALGNTILTAVRRN